MNTTSITKRAATVAAWVITVPAAALLSAIVFLVLDAAFV